MNEALVRDFINAVKAENKKTSAYDTPATVTRVDGGTAWVHIPGGVDETPIKMTVNAKKGDTVQVRVADGRAWIVGNETAPPTDDAKANEADKKAAEAKYLAVDAVDAALKADIAAQDAVASAETAKEAAETAQSSATAAQSSATAAQSSATAAQSSATAAQSSANNALASAQNASEYAARALGNLSTVQSVAETLTWITQHGTMTLTSDVALDPTHVYFVRNDATGYYTVGAHKYDIVTEPDIDDIGTYYELTIDESLNNYVGTHLALTQEGLWLLPASSGTNKVLIATGAGSTYTTPGTYILDSTGATAASFRGDGATINGPSATNIAHLGYGPGKDGSGNTANAPYYTLGTRATGSTVGNYSVAEGTTTTASAYAAHSEGSGTTASGLEAHAEGNTTTASGRDSHAQGANTTASNTESHAEGYYTTASGQRAHAEGNGTTASGDNSHAQNAGTTAQRKSQTALGEFNVLDTTGTTSTRGDYAVIVGNGTANNARSNALTVKWDGETELKGLAKITKNSNTVTIGSQNSSWCHIYNSANIPFIFNKGICTTSGDLGTSSYKWGNLYLSGDASIGGNVNIGSGKKYQINGANLSASDVGAVPLSGGTMTGQLLTSFKTSVAMGSYGSAQTTVPNFIGEVRYSSGCSGSVNIGTAYTKDGVTVPTGWYNFTYMPHRSGGVNGSASGDNCNYGNCILSGMTGGFGRYFIRVSGGNIDELCRIVTTKELNQAPSTSGLSGYSSRCTISNGGIYTIGNQVFVTMKLKIAASLSANNYWTLVQGLPTPSYEQALACSGISKNGTALSAYVTTSGQIVVATDNAALASGDYVTVCGWYLKA